MPKRKAQTELNGVNGHSNGAPKKEEMKGLGGTTDLPPADTSHTAQNAWSGPGPAAFDFRSQEPPNSPSLYSQANTDIFSSRRCSNNTYTFDARRDPKHNIVR